MRRAIARGRHLHGAEFQNRKELLVPSHALLAEKDRAGIVEKKNQTKEQKNRRQDQKAE